MSALSFAVTSCFIGRNGLNRLNSSDAMTAPWDTPIQIGDILDRYGPERSLKCLFSRYDFNIK